MISCGIIVSCSRIEEYVRNLKVSPIFINSTIITIVKNYIREVLDKIHAEIINKEGGLSILGGKYGFALFDFYYRKQYNLNLDDNPKLSLQQLAEESFTNTNPTFSNGIAGLRWYFSFLYHHKVIEFEDYQILSPPDNAQEELAIEMLSIGNYDFLHGAIGIAYNFIYSSNNHNKEFIKVFIFKLTQLLERGKENQMIPWFDSLTKQIKPNSINLGFAHGIPSILKFCIECYKNDLAKEESKILGQIIIDFLIKNANQGKNESYFPYFLDLDTNRYKFSRLAWCYGDLTIGYVMYHAGLIFNHQNSKELGMEILLNCTKRKSYETTLITDAGICHGTAGVAHIFNKCWKETNDPVFKVASEYWIEKTIDYFNSPTNLGGYKKYITVSNEYELDSGILEGSAGIGLVLLSFLSDDFDWDYCLMLNN